MKHKILLADSNQTLLEQIQASANASSYRFDTVTNGMAVLDTIELFQPDLIVMDLLLPQMHGIELLKKIRANPKWEDLGVILISTNSMVQNFHAALKEGADYFLPKPFDIPFLYVLFERFFEKTLSPEPFAPKTKQVASTSIYHPQKQHGGAYLKFWGTRGSNPVSGPRYVRFGGNTMCLEVRDHDHVIIIDAGTGISALGDTLDPASHKTIHLFLSHTHWDHLMGFPFFSLIYNSDVNVIIWSPVGFEKTTQELFTEMLAYAYFPVRLEDIRAKLSFQDLRDGHRVSIGNISIDSHYAYHPGATLCFKLHVAGKTIGYATDNEVFLGYHGNPNAIGPTHPLIQNHQSLIHFFQDVDYLIHEAQYTPAEYEKRVGWGHSSISNAALLCKFVKPTHWIATHHDPMHTDQELLDKQQLHRDILQDCGIDCFVQMAFDDMQLWL